MTLFFFSLGVFSLIIVIIIKVLEKLPKKASISFTQRKKGIVINTHFRNIEKKKEKEILKDIKFDLIQIEYKLKNHFNPTPNIKNWKND